MAKRRRRKKRFRMRRDALILCVIYGIVLILVVIGAIAVSNHITIRTDSAQSTAENNTAEETEKQEDASAAASSAVSETSSSGDALPDVSAVLSGSAVSNSVVSSGEETETSKVSTTEETADDGLIHITISAAGDCTLGKDSKSVYATSLPAYYDKNGPSYFFAGVKDVFDKDDLTIVNLEGALTTAEKAENSQFAFKADPSYVDILTDGSVEACNLANNHSHDFGDQGYEDTQKTLEDADISGFGYEDYSIVTVKDKKIGLIGAYFLSSRSKNTEIMKTAIESAKKDGADIIIVSCHWGGEKETKPRSYEKEVAHTAIDAGADLILGTHAHVIQGIETYNGKYICYSLGNFCFGGNKNPQDKDTFIFQQTFNFDASGNLAEVTDADINLIPCRISSVTDKNDYQPTILTGEEGEEVLAKITERSEKLK